MGRPRTAVSKGRSLKATRRNLLAFCREQFLADFGITWVVWWGDSILGRPPPDEALREEPPKPGLTGTSEDGLPIQVARGRRRVVARVREQLVAREEMARTLARAVVDLRKAALALKEAVRSAESLVTGADSFFGDVDRARGVAEGLPLSLFEYQEPGPEPVERVRVLERAARFVPSPPAGGWQARHFAVVGILSRVRPTVLPGETVGAVFERERKNYNRLMANQTVTSD